MKMLTAEQVRIIIITVLLVVISLVDLSQKSHPVNDVCLNLISSLGEYVWNKKLYGFNNYTKFRLYPL